MIVWLASYPRSGNTFLRVLLNHVFGIKTYSIYDDPEDIGADAQTSEVVGHVPMSGLDIAQARSEPGLTFVKTHDLPGGVIQPEDRVVYVIREGREACFSYFRYVRDFFRRPVRLEQIILGNNRFGTWAGHVRAWNPLSRDNCLLVRFEDLTQRPMDFAKALAEFAEIPAVSEELPTFEELQKINPKFFRSGKAASWKETYSSYQNLLFWMQSKDVMLEFGYDQDMPDEVRETSFELFRMLHERIHTIEDRLRRFASDREPAWRRPHSDIQRFIRAFESFRRRNPWTAPLKRRRAFRKLLKAYEKVLADNS